VEDVQLNKAQRFVRIVELLQRQGGISAGELMGRFDLDDRSLRRYLKDLREMDLPLRDEGRGSTRRFWLDANYGRQGVQVSLLELVSLHFGRSLFGFLKGTGFAADMDDALETLSTLATQAPGLDLAQNLDRKFMAVPEHRKDHTHQADLLDDLLSALLYQNPSEAHYAKIGGRTRRYRLHPYTLATFRQGLYLFALDEDENRVKTFAVDRFRHFERERGARFEIPDDYHPSQMVHRAFGIIQGPLRTVVLRFNRWSSPYITERIWHESQVLEPSEDGGVRLTMEVGIAHELKSWILGFGPDVVVEGPTELAAEVADLLARAHYAARERAGLSAE
jgi:predicted DNA-binding transcriptional regulator YafY